MGIFKFATRFHATEAVGKLMYRCNTDGGIVPFSPDENYPTTSAGPLPVAYLFEDIIEGTFNLVTSDTPSVKDYADDFERRIKEMKNR